MRHYRWEGSATALSSVAHGGPTLGTVTYLRREKFLMPDGTVEEVPVVSGNGLRGVLRDAAAEMLWEHLGSPRLPLPVVHALWSGGALVKAKGEVLSGQRLARLRALVPHVGVFGAAGGGRIIDGALQVGKLLPVCAQTAHLLPPALAHSPCPDMWNLLQVEEYTRLPNAERLPEVLASSGPPPVPPGPQAPGVPGTPHGPGVDGAGDLETGADGLMRYGVETFAAGTRFHTWFALHNATAVERSFFAEALARFSANAFVGGRIARGHGRLRLQVDEECLDGQGEVADWREHTAGSRQEAIEALRWLD